MTTRTANLLTREQAATYLHCSTAWLQRHRDTGGPPYYLVGRRYLYAPDDLDTWLLAQRVEPQTAPTPQPKESEWDGVRSTKTASARSSRSERTAAPERVLRGTRTSRSRASDDATAHARQIAELLELSPPPGAPSSSPAPLQLVTGDGA